MKIGIITHYYQSTNYGGNLQAYALQRFLAENHQVEQIRYKNDRRTPIKKSTLLKELGLIGFFKRCIRYLLSKIKKCFTKKKKNISRVLEKRSKAILAFNEQIPHSSRCYNAETIYEAEKEYDCFITGSDQVWHPLAVNEAYLLNFVKEKPKFSYAASLAVSQLTEQQRQRMQRSLKNYQDISVREENSIALLKNTTDKTIKWVLDPVFLILFVKTGKIN